MEAPRRALFIAAVQPDANGTGVQRRAYQHLWCLSQLFALDVVIQPRRPARAALPEALRGACHAHVTLPVIEAQYVQIPPELGRGMTALRELRHVFDRVWQPYGEATRTRALGQLEEGLRGPYALVFCFRLDTGWLEPWARSRLAPDGRLVMDLDDRDSDFMAQQARLERAERGAEMTAAAHLRARRLASIERHIAGHFDIITFSSPGDALARSGRGARQAVLPNCVQLSAAPLAPRAAGDGAASLLFVGFLGYSANADAVLHFCTAILPLIREGSARPVELVVVGRDAPAAVQALHAPPGVTITGWVESLPPCYAAADLVVMPLRMGSGTRIKALEAMDFGRPLVSSTLGVLGLDLVAGRHVRLADTPQEFARACLHLLAHPAEAAAQVAAARAHVAARFSFEAALGTLRDLLR
jgi:glycosyltransferase involved in cell wall biosynthesis